MLFLPIEHPSTVSCYELDASSPVLSGVALLCVNAESIIPLCKCSLQGIRCEVHGVQGLIKSSVPRVLRY